MSGESFRFIHAGDFHLETPLGDLDVVPAAIKPALVAAPRAAVTAIFDAALAENVDFLVLSGDLVSPAAAGPHGMSLIIEGLERLAAKDKPVFWTTGKTDDAAKWPDAIPLPGNVHLFGKAEAEMVPVQRGGRTICVVVGQSSDGRGSINPTAYAIETTDHFSVAVGCGATDAKSLAGTDIDHWCLGGKKSHRTLDCTGETTAAYCGSPQGRGRDQDGGHGYVVVDVDSDRTRRIHHVACDVVRYVNVPVEAAEIAASGSLKNLLSSAISRAATEAAGRHVMLHFDIRIAGGEDMSLVGNTADLLETLRREHGGGNPATWTAGIDVTGPRQFPKAWREEDTILGDFLRAAESVRESGDAPSMLPLTEETPLPEAIANRLADPAESRLDDATRLGVRMLRGEKV